MNSFLPLQKAAYEANLMLPKSGLVLLTFGNVSAASQQDGVFAIKPSGIPYEELQPEMMVIVDFEGNVVQGSHRPSSDTLTHAVLYKHWPGVEGIAHTHSTYATAWAQSLRPIPIYGTTHADHLTCDIPCAPPMEDEHIQGNYEYETGFQIIRHLKDCSVGYEDLSMILVGNHAPFTWGKNAEKAVYHSVVLESVAQMAYLSEQINPDISRMKNSLIRKHYERKHGPDAYYGQEK